MYLQRQDRQHSSMFQVRDDKKQAFLAGSLDYMPMPLGLMNSEYCRTTMMLTLNDRQCGAAMDGQLTLQRSVSRAVQ
jgi:hypothetical protein